MSRRIVYYPPSLPTIGKFVQGACKHLTEENPSYIELEVQQGLTQFLWIAANILAKHLNSENHEVNSVDRPGK